MCILFLSTMPLSFSLLVRYAFNEEARENYEQILRIILPNKIPHEIKNLILSFLCIIPETP